MTEEERIRSFKTFEKKVEAATSAGMFTREKAREMTDSARKNYSEASYNRELDRMEKERRK
jgi:hypothetical protein